jgi:hypothetical protein
MLAVADGIGAPRERDAPSDGGDREYRQQEEKSDSDCGKAHGATPICTDDLRALPFVTTAGVARRAQLGENVM